MDHDCYECELPCDCGNDDGDCDGCLQCDIDKARANKEDYYYAKCQEDSHEPLS